MNIDDYSDDTLSIEAQVARSMGDEDWEDLAHETPRWAIGGTIAKRTERDRMSFDTPVQPNDEWSH